MCDGIGLWWWCSFVHEGTRAVRKWIAFDGLILIIIFRVTPPSRQPRQDNFLMSSPPLLMGVGLFLNFSFYWRCHWSFGRIRNADRIRRCENIVGCLLLRWEELELRIHSVGDSVRTDSIEYWRCNEFGLGSVHCPSQWTLPIQFRCTGERWWYLRPIPIEWKLDRVWIWIVDIRHPGHHSDCVVAEKWSNRQLPGSGVNLRKHLLHAIHGNFIGRGFGPFVIGPTK